MTTSFSSVQFWTVGTRRVLTAIICYVPVIATPVLLGEIDNWKDKSEARHSTRRGDCDSVFVPGWFILRVPGVGLLTLPRFLPNIQDRSSSLCISRAYSGHGRERHAYLGGEKGRAPLRLSGRVRVRFGRRVRAAPAAVLQDVVVVPYGLGLCREYGKAKAILAPGRAVAPTTFGLRLAASGIPVLTHNSKHFDGIGHPAGQGAPLRKSKLAMTPSEASVRSSSRAYFTLSLFSSSVRLGLSASLFKIAHYSRQRGSWAPPAREAPDRWNVFESWSHL